MNRLAIIFTIFYAGIAFTAGNTTSAPKPMDMTNESTMDIIDPPNTAALNIMVNALSSLKELKKQNQASPENIKTLIEIKMLPNIAIEVSTELALKEHWGQLNQQQKLIFQRYITQSLIKDYASILGSYDGLDSINITVDPKVKRKDNKAIVKLVIYFNENPKPITISLKMIRTTHWRIYDVVFAGVSIIKNYHAQFNSHIRRKGVDSLIAKVIKKLG